MKIKELLAQFEGINPECEVIASTIEINSYFDIIKANRYIGTAGKEKAITLVLVPAKITRLEHSGPANEY